MKNFGSYFNIKILIKAFVVALLLSSPIYLIHFGLEDLYLNSLLVAFGFWLLLGLNAKEAFWSGFFIGLLWFYWIGLSFRYYDLSWMIPFVIFFVALVYGLLLFGLFFVSQKFGQFSLLAKILAIASISYIHPFGFNWFVPEMLLAHTIFHPQKLYFLLFLAAMGALYLPRQYKLLALALLLCIDYHPQKHPLPNLDIQLVTTHIPQDKKWLPQYRERIVKDNFHAIKEAIAHKKDLVVLPESAFPLFLNTRPGLLERLQNLSHQIAILTGALYLSEGHYYNSTYLFDQGKVKIFNKVVLVPFGEEIPLPKPIARWINEHFFGGSSDYTHASHPATFTIKGYSFTNAICYEATHPIIYQTPTPYIIAVSNNAWFLPSIEPTLQWMIIKYYATIYKKVVFHATNYAKTAIIEGR